MKLCPLCKESLDKAIFYGVEVDYCPLCLGMFFEEGELELAKDKKDESLRWQDIKLFEKENLLKALPSQGKVCPHCRLPLWEISYPSSYIYENKLEEKVKIDICKSCQGVWLDRGEFKKIIQVLKEQAFWDLKKSKLKTLISELWEVFMGPKALREEIEDVIALIKILALRKEDIFKKED